ncbi:flhG Antiactivator of flagellar biosynthesis FleN, an ATPase [Mycobacteriaceae bacterium]
MDPNFSYRYFDADDTGAPDPVAEPYSAAEPDLDGPTYLDADPDLEPDPYGADPAAAGPDPAPAAVVVSVPPRPAPARRTAPAGPRTGPQPAARPAARPATPRPGDPQQWGAQPAPPRPAPARVARDLAPSPTGGAARTSTFSTGSIALRVEDVATPRKAPPEIGWRKSVYRGSGKLINLGAGRAEQQMRAYVDAIQTNIPGNYTVGVVSIKGGVGKTHLTAGLGSVFAHYRTEPVICLDASPTYGNLGRLVAPDAPSSMREFLADDTVATYPMTRAYTGKNRQGLEVLPGNQNVANPLGLTETMFDDTLARVRQFYQLALVDCGPHIEHRVMRSVLSQCDALVIVGTMSFDGASSVETTLDWLDARNSHELLRRSCVVLNDVHDNHDPKFLSTVEKSLAPRVGGLATVPFDKHLRDGHSFDYRAIHKRTALAYIGIAAWLAEGFAGAGSR